MKKAHEEWSASSADPNFACAGRVVLIANVPPAEETIHAAWGTGVHFVGEQSLTQDIEPFELLDTVVKTDKFEIPVDDEVVDTAKVYTDYVRSRIALNAGTQFWIEETFNFSAFNFPIKTGGTGDCVIWNPILRQIEIVDLKGGRGHFVDIKKAKQPWVYGLGAVHKHPLLPVETVRMTIVQPRIPDKRGIIRSIDIHVTELVDFANDILDAQKLTMQAKEELTSPITDEWRDTFLVAGEHCVFCPAAGMCPALRKASQDMVGMYWDEFDAPVVETEIKDNDPRIVERDLEAIEMIEQWITARRSYAHQLAEGGHQFDGWTLVERNGHRKWNNLIPDQTAREIEKATGLALIELYERKLKSPAGIERALGKDKKKIAGLYHTPVIGKDLVRKSKAGSRRPAESLVDKFFNS